MKRITHHWSAIAFVVPMLPACQPAKKCASGMNTDWELFPFVKMEKSRAAGGQQLLTA